MLKIKIYIFHPYSGIGGADLSLSRLINNLDKRFYDITFITLKSPKIRYYLKRKIEIISLNSNRTIFSIMKLRNIILSRKKKDKEFKKIIFISNQNFANIISLISLYKINHLKTILIERNHPDELTLVSSYKNLIIKYLIKYLYKYADYIIGISKTLSKDLGNLCKKKVITIYNPSFDKKILEIKKIKTNGKKLILCVARLEKQKNHIMLLEAFKNSLKTIKSNLLLIGYGSEKNKILKFIKKNKLKQNVKIISNAKNAYKYYKKADLFVLTSLYEGFGNVLVEAGAFKIPIISTNCNSGPKEILKNGLNGYLVKINDIDTLTKLIVKNLNKPNKLKINNMFKSLKEFSLEQNVKKYEKIFKKI